ncbi:hypothetical protein EW145_g2467 [Phellinidium pouzarii]|uniref:Uncharacterized protein n=1 Tax=Phellinidium pouzarii TaxID=167371 RepID=A0A4V3XD87_9AGAM|nr:hypothetical protein EW145_g2467 [Phellinidium pouzarii]
MFKLLRRISGSFTNRLDRVWDDDATSSAPQSGKKRRMSDEDDEVVGSLSKRSRGHADTIPEEDESGTPLRDASLASSSTVPQLAKETEEVRQVTKGVKEVELEDKAEEEVKPSTGSEGAPKKAAVVLAEAELSSEKSKSTGLAEVEGEPSVDMLSSEKGSESLDLSKADDVPAIVNGVLLVKSGEDVEADEHSADASSDVEDAIDSSSLIQSAELDSTIAESVPASEFTIKSDEAPMKAQG